MNQRHMQRVTKALQERAEQAIPDGLKPPPIRERFQGATYAVLQPQEPARRVPPRAICGSVWLRCWLLC